VSAPLLEVRGLVKRFGGVRALDGVTFQVPQGVVQGLVGPNGSGKTTVVDCVTGFQFSDSGQVLFQGEKLDKLPAFRRARLGIRRTFQTLKVFEEMTVLEELLLARQSFERVRLGDEWFRTPRLRRVEREAHARALEALSLVHLEGFVEHFVHELSYGQRKLVALAGALMSEPTLLCLDEPLAGVSPRQVDEIAAVVKNLRSSGITILIVEHNVDFVASVSDEVVVMAEGHVHTQGPPSVLRDDESVFEVLLGGR
jgi:branched-chain amino acid transport system ATP-binding protein